MNKFTQTEIDALREAHEDLCDAEHALEQDLQSPEPITDNKVVVELVNTLRDVRHIKNTIIETLTKQGLTMEQILA